MGKLNDLIFLPGLALSLAIAMIALALSDTSMLKQYALSPLTLAILFGIGVGNSIFPKNCLTMCKRCQVFASMVIAVGYYSVWLSAYFFRYYARWIARSADRLFGPDKHFCIGMDCWI